MILANFKSGFKRFPCAKFSVLCLGVFKSKNQFERENQFSLKATKHNNISGCFVLFFVPITTQNSKDMLTNCKRLGNLAKISKSMRTSFWSKIGNFKVG